jgi:hypothetical protein
MNQSEMLAILADSLVERGYCILDDAIPEDLLIKLIEQSRALDSDDLELAGIGRDDLNKLIPEYVKTRSPGLPMVRMSFQRCFMIG